MKLSAEKKDRLQMFILIGFVAVGVLVAIFMFVVAPVARARKLIPRQLEEVNANLLKAEQAIASVPQNHAQYNALAAIVQTTVDDYMLQPVLGSYILEAERLIEQEALAVGVTIDSYREIGIRDLPKPPRRREGYRLRSYTVSVALKTDYDALMRLIDALERGNPFVSVLGLNVFSQPRTPQVHDVRFDVQWAIWGGGEDVPQLRSESGAH